MSEEIDELDRRKAEFLAAYRCICQEYGLLIIKMHSPDDQYLPFRLAFTDSSGLRIVESSIQEMLLEPIVKIRIV